MKQQRGGTFLGIIIGILLGLGGALALAVYVNKVPIPFVNKGQNRSNEQDAAEAQKNRNWDPNAPLYGKNPVRPGAAPSTPAAGPVAIVPAAPTVPPPVQAPDAKPPAATSDPLGDLAKLRSAGVDPFNYFVQAGAYRTADDAEAQRARLSLGGIEARVSEREQAGRLVYRVRIGPFEHREDADKAKDKIEALGMEAAMVRVQR